MRYIIQTIHRHNCRQDYAPSIVLRHSPVTQLKRLSSILIRLPSFNIFLELIVQLFLSRRNLVLIARKYQEGEDIYES